MSLSDLIVPSWVKVVGSLFKTFWPVLLVGGIALSGWYMIHRIDSLKIQNTELVTKVSALNSNLEALVHEQERFNGLLDKKTKADKASAKKAQDAINQILSAPKDDCLDRSPPVDLCSLYPEYCHKGRSEDSTTQGASRVVPTQ